MDWATIVEWIISILSGLAICIPLVIKLCDALKSYISEKNWSALVAMVVQLMQQAEGLFEKGKDKKAWVMEQLEATAIFVNYKDYDAEKISALIDTLCDMSKIVNAPQPCEG